MLNKCKKYVKNKGYKILIEIMDAILVVGGVFLLGMVILYFNAFIIEFGDFFGSKVLKEDLYVFDEELHVDKESLLHLASETDFDDLLSVDHKVVQSSLHTYELEDYLQQSFAYYGLPMTTVAPGRRLLIKAGEVDIDAPIIDVQYATPERLENGDFYDELKQGVVKYPSTPSPEEDGSMLLFGHSSVATYEAIKNKYGFIFYKLPKLQENDEIELVWDGKLYSYSITHKLVTRPDEVAENIPQEKGSHSLVLMACYPLFSTAQRMLVYADLQETKSSIYSYVGKNVAGKVTISGDKYAFKSQG